jgi:deoxyribodipyrimidine photo-lyase
VAKPVNNPYTNYFSGSVSSQQKDLIETMSSGSMRQVHISGGRTEALHILEDLKRFKDYEKQRDIPAERGTTTLSAHHKFGTCSVRESYHAVARQLGKGHTLIRELYWRDFFTHIAYHFPHVFGHAFYEDYEALKWSKDQEMFKRWSEGTTGFPIVDAGMRELNATGFMHNRVRMITASLLVKDLHIDWRWGEQYFAQKLVDYDPCVNNGNWQWVASTGCDHQPYFRVFNPWLQQRRFDGDCRYIKRWVPELRDTDVKDIHDRSSGSREFGEKDYPDPIVEHETESQKAKEMFRAVKKKGV